MENLGTSAYSLWVAGGQVGTRVDRPNSVHMLWIKKIHKYTGCPPVVTPPQQLPLWRASGQPLTPQCVDGRIAPDLWTSRGYGCGFEQPEEGIGALGSRCMVTAIGSM